MAEKSIPCASPARGPSIRLRAEPPFALHRADSRLAVIVLSRHMIYPLAAVVAYVAFDIAGRVVNLARDKSISASGKKAGD